MDMTWHKPARLIHRGLCLPLCVLLVGVLAACGSSTKNASIQITAPEKGAVLTLKDDTDKSTPGLQYTVTAAASDVAPGTDVVLRIGDESELPVTTVGQDGLIEFKDVTLPRGKHTLKVTTGNSGIQSADDWEFTHKALSIESPRDGSVISSESDDKDPSAPGVQINVTIKTYAIDLGEDVVLQVDGEPVDSPMNPNNSETLTFSGVTLSNGDHTLKAVAGEVESDPVRISVNPTCATASFVLPVVPMDGSAVELGGGDMCPAEGEQFKTNFMVSTSAGDGRSVDLYVNGTLASNARVEGTVVTFEDVVLDRYNTANEVEIVVEAAQGVECDPIPFPVAINLDCEGVDCSISAPKPFAGNDDEGKRVQYLNGSHKTGDGFEFEVHTDAAAVGHPVKLIIDGRETDAPEADPSGSDPDVKAIFKGVELSEGEHTIVARCEHESGTFALSRRATWIVDTLACDVDIQSPMGDMLLVAGFDENPTLGGTQIELEADLGGDDCRRARTAPCNPDDGIADTVGYEDIDGDSPLRILVTLANEPEQNLCLDVLDRAGNRGSDSVAVRYQPEAPKLEIESPADGARYNASGGTGYARDTDRGSATVCNAHFDVACSQLGATIRLHRGDENGTVFGMGECEARGNGDPELPSGYVGRARLRNLAFLAGTDDTVTVVATQSTGSNDVVGQSAAITLRGDCELPELTFTGDDPCEGGQIGVEDADTVAVKDIVVADSTVDTEDATLTVTSEGSASTPRMEAVNGNTYTFDNVELGAPGDTPGKRDIVLEVTATDDFGNLGRVSCEASIVFDLPILTVTAPADNAFFTTTSGLSPGLCEPTPGTVGVQIAASADVAANRTAAVSVNGDAPIALTLNGTAIEGCIPIEPGPNELVFTLVSGRTTATATVTRRINLVTAVPDTGITLNAPVVPADRTGQVTLSWTLPTEQFSGQFVSYDLRCGTRPYDSGRVPAWWDVAHPVELPADFRPPTATVDLAMRVGEEAHCMLRAADAAGNLTPVTTSTSLKVPFRQARFTGAAADHALGADVAGVGDVNGDGIADLLVGGIGHAYLIFGNEAGWSSSTPNVTFSSTTPNSYLGAAVAAIGNFNADDDNRPDFAIAEFSATGTVAAGRVHVFFGRTRTDEWPGQVNLTGAGCVADLCFTAATAGAQFGTSVGTAGDFDGDGIVDLGVGAPRHTSASGSGRMYVLRGGRQYTTGMTRSGDFFARDIPVESGAARSGFVFEATGTLRLGSGFASVGTFDSANGGDLIIGAQGNANANVAPVQDGSIYFASGRTYVGPEITVLPVAQLGLRGAGGTPSGTPLDTGAPGFGVAVYALGNAYDVPAASRPGVVDVAVYRNGDVAYTMYTGDTDFAAAERIRVGAASGEGSYFGSSVCTGVDMDDDGVTETCAAGELNLVDNTRPGTAYLWYGDNFALQLETRAEGTLPRYENYTESASLIDAVPTGTVDTTALYLRPGSRVVDFVGDLNGDGRPDMAVGTPTSNDSAGELTILY
jgi:hypothetical protein